MRFTISTDKSKLDIPMIHSFLSRESYWAKGRSLQTVNRAVENSLCFGVYSESGKQVGFARVVSDFAVFAWILDLFILPAYRGSGLGKNLMQEIMDHPDLQSLQRWGLNTVDAQGLYRQFGFQSLKNPQFAMEIVKQPR
ncbi:MAG: GNAT family N-acetyltransferase [Calditrichia bacterium]